MSNKQSSGNINTENKQSSENKKESGKITIANFIALIGLVLLLIFTFLGRSYKSGGETGWDIVISVGITGFTAFLLWFLIKAKSAENDLKKWRIVEFITLGVYILFAIGSSIFGGIMHFFVVNANKETIKTYADADLSKIDTLFVNYKNFESQALSITENGLHNATGPNQLCDLVLNQFMTDNQIAHSRVSADNYINIQRNALIGGDFDRYYNEFKNMKTEISNTVNGWNYLKIPWKAKQITELAEQAKIELHNLSNKAQLPLITYNHISRSYTLGDFQKKDFDTEGTVTIKSFQFRKALQEANGFSITALLIVLGIHALIIFNYIVAYRTLTLSISKDLEDDGGHIL